jgi:hypothetical protein
LERSITPSSKCELPSSPVQSRIQRIIEPLLSFSSGRRLAGPCL